MHLRVGKPADAPAISVICHRQFQVAHQGGFIEEDLLYYVDKTFNEEAVNADLADGGFVYYVAIGDDAKLLGCIRLGKAALPQTSGTASAAEITRLYVLPELIGKGVGAALMQKAIKWATEEGFTTLWLHVYKKNQQAIDFYTRAGFRIVGELEFPVRDSRPVGWVMMRDLTTTA